MIFKDQLSLIKSISSMACQDTDPDGQNLAKFYSAVTPAIFINLITQLEETKNQLAELNLLQDVKLQMIEELTKEYDSDLVKKKLSNYAFSPGRWHWPEIVEKRKSFLEKLLGHAIEDGSVLDEILSGIAIESREGAYSAVAAALGLDSRALQAVLLTWEESQDTPPPRVTFDELKTKIMLYKQLLNAT